MKKLSVILFFACTIVLFIFLGCQKEGSEEYASEVEFYKHTQLVNIYENEIVPLSSNFVDEAKRLEDAAKTFQGDVTTTNLAALQDQWKVVQMVWKKLELYDLGAVADSFISFEINRWPTDSNRIDANIEGVEAINANFVTSLGSSSKGISGLEYLLFSSDITDFTTETNAVRRLAYLVALSENLNTKSKELHSLWKDNGANFTDALENGIEGSQNQVINAMITLIEEIIISKLGSSLGDTNGGTIEPERLEAHRSEISKEIIQQHLEALERVYDGDFAQTPFRVGFDDFLILIGSENFSNKIENQFKVCQTKLNAIQGSLENELTTNPDAVVDLKNSFRDLLVLIKVDMANVLGSTITFNDNDGD